MKALILTLVALSVIGCATKQATLISNNPDNLVIGTKPEGYPKTHIEPYPGVPGFCREVKESWKEDTYQGQAIWLKNKELNSMRCPQ